VKEKMKENRRLRRQKTARAGQRARIRLGDGAWPNKLFSAQTGRRASHRKLTAAVVAVSVPAAPRQPNILRFVPTGFGPRHRRARTRIADHQGWQPQRRSSLIMAARRLPPSCRDPARELYWGRYSESQGFLTDILGTATRAGAMAGPKRTLSELTDSTEPRKGPEALGIGLRRPVSAELYLVQRHGPTKLLGRS